MPNELVRRNLCADCGGPAPVLEARIGGGDVAVKARYCDTCAPIAAVREARIERERLAEMLLLRAGGAGLRDWSLSSYPDDELGRRGKAAAATWFEALRIVRDEPLEVASAFGPNLLIFGAVGTGKTGLAWSLVRACCEELVPALQLNFRDHLWHVRAAFAENAARDERPHKVSVLALDDLGAERPSGFAREELATLVEHRTQRRLPTIVTSNYTPDDLAARLGHDDPVVGQRIVSRLAQEAHQLRLDGSDRRLAA